MISFRKGWAKISFPNYILKIKNILLILQSDPEIQQICNKIQTLFSFTEHTYV